jgi:hypothetical protein
MAEAAPPQSASFTPFAGLDELEAAAVQARNAAAAPKVAKPRAPRKPAQKPVRIDKETNAALDVLLGPKPAEPGSSAPAPKRARQPAKPRESRPSKRAKTTPDSKAKEAKAEDKRKRDDEHRRTMAQLAAYASNEVLGPHLTQREAFDLSPKKLRSLTKKQAVDLLEDVEDTLANSSHQALADHAVREGMQMIEYFAHERTRFKVKGTTDKCFANQHWRFLLERAKIKYGVGLGSLDPVAELALVTVSTATMMHNQNVMATGSVDLDKPVSNPTYPKEAPIPQ